MVPITELTDRAFMASVIRNRETAVIQFLHRLDVSCLSMKVNFDELACEYMGTSFARVDAHENCDTASRCGLLVFPSILVFEDGVEVKRIVGVKRRIVLFRELSPWLKE